MRKKITRGILDAFVMALFALSLIPLLLFGFSSILLLIINVTLIFSYYIIMDRNKEELAIGIISWPIATIILAVPFQIFFFIQPKEVLLLWFSYPGAILFLFTVFAASTAVIITKNNASKAEQEKGASEI